MSTLAEDRNGGAVPARDGLRLALINSRFEAIVRAMGNTLLRSARSAVLSSAKDFSVCVLTAEGEMVSMVESLPVHVVGADLQARHMRDTHGDLRAGDAFLHNSPYHGNSHAADWGLLVPVVDAGGTHRYTVLAKAHLADCGNAMPTTYMASAKDVYEEGALIFPSVKVQDGYRDVDDIVRMAQARIRVPDMWWGDYLALVGAARIGERRVLALLDEHGPEELEAYLRDWFDYSEQRMIEAIADLPAGSKRSSGFHDAIPGVLDDGVEIHTEVTVDPAVGEVTVDLRDNPDCLPSGANLTEATSRAAAINGVFVGLGGKVPVNAGSFRRINVLLRENCCVGIPRHPASCSLATTNLSEIVGACVSSSFATFSDRYGIAEFGRIQPASWAVVSGTDPRREGAPFINQFFLACTGGAGTPVADGWLTAQAIAAAGNIRQDSVEIDELKYPIRVLEQRLVPDSEGPGRRRGAPSARVEFGPVETSIDVAYISDGTYTAPRGVRGGGNGATAQQRKRDTDGETSDELGVFSIVRLDPGESIVSVTSSGAGYGPPEEREPERVLDDVREQLVSCERAREVYRVAIENGVVDDAATAMLRAAEGIDGGTA